MDKLIANGLVPVYESSKGNPTVDARTLHKGLNVGRDFSNWIKDKLSKYSFKENEDYLVYAKSGENPTGGRPSTEYALTLDCAKEIAMAESTEQGHKVRQYFISVEKQWNSPEYIMQRALRIADSRVKILAAENAALKPKAEYYDTILANPGLVTTTQIAKDYGMSGQAMNDLLHKCKIQYKQSKQWLLYKEYASCGYVGSRTTKITHSDGSPDVVMHTAWTQKGRKFIYELLKKHDILPVIEQLN